ncbi:hypothetical protein BC937DRAFT_86183 [Endogone sp. FLAS-F59071]|nr:hypothetical protein BC937DRAFT_86183 [Endogone sp. FLAS-F59071]|eukprot:RUS13189.1 hypothetical protein BC937DRAFT_86183 [Endogone sp. FLAS-F59071]
MTTTVRIEFRNGRFKTAYDHTLDGYLTEAEFERRVSTLNAAARTERLKGSGSALALFCTMLVIVFLFTLLLVLRGLTSSTVTGILIIGIPVVFGSLLIFCVWMRLYKNQFGSSLDGICDRFNAQDYNKRIHYRLDKVFDHEIISNYRPVCSWISPSPSYLAHINIADQQISYVQSPLLHSLSQELVISLGYRLPTADDGIVVAMQPQDTDDQVDALPLYTFRRATTDVVVQDSSELPPIPDIAPPKYIP